MSLKTRRILFIIFLLAFFTITPLIILYANGYKLSAKGKLLQKTGMLVLDSSPRGAKIYINDKPKKMIFKFFSRENNALTTPAKIKNILPGEYKIKIEKDGYWPWEKKLAVQSGMATFAEDINLFKNNLPLLVSDQNISKILAAPNGKSLLVGNDNIYFLNTDDDEKIPLKGSIPSSTDNFSLINNQFALIEGIMYRINSADPFLDLNKYFDAANSIIKPAEEEGGLFYLSASDGTEEYNSINKFNILTKKISNVITAEKILDYAVKGENLYFINQVAENKNLKIYNLKSNNIVRFITLPSSSDYEFINPGHRLINLYDKSRDTLYLINPFSPDPLREKIENIKIAKWIDGDKLLYANDFEIWLTNFTSNQTILITRISEQIKDVDWHPSDNYVIYSTDNSIFTIELDDREKRTVTLLVKTDEISNLTMVKGGKTLYFYAKTGNQKGLYKLIIQ